MSLVVDSGEEIFPGRFVLHSGLVSLCIDLLQLLQVFIIVVMVLTDQTGIKTSRYSTDEYFIFLGGTLRSKSQLDLINQSGSPGPVGFSRNKIETN